MGEHPRMHELIRGALRLRREIDARGIDIVHTFLYRANVVARIAGRLSRRSPVVISSQRSLQPLGGWQAGFAARWTRGLSGRVVAVSQAVRDELSRAEGIPSDSIIVIANGVDTVRFHESQENGRSAAVGDDPGAVVVGTVGRLSSEKGVHHLLDAVALA